MKSFISFGENLADLLRLKDRLYLDSNFCAQILLFSFHRVSWFLIFERSGTTILEVPSLASSGALILSIYILCRGSLIEELIKVAGQSKFRNIVRSLSHSSNTVLLPCMQRTEIVLPPSLRHWFGAGSRIQGRSHRHFEKPVVRITRVHYKNRRKKLNLRVRWTGKKIILSRYRSDILH